MTPPGRTTDSTRLSPGGVLSQRSIAVLIRRDRVVISASIVLVVGLAWTRLLHLDRQMAMTMSWTATDAFFAFIMWTVMMAAMMIPSAAPVLLLFAAARSRRGARDVPTSVLVFGLGYILLWVGFSACAALAQWALHDAAMLSP